MSNTTLTADIIAAEAITILDNNLVMSKQVFRGYENEFAKRVNGYTVGDEISIRKPTDFTVRDGAVMDVQDVTEGKTTIKVDKRKGVDFRFTSQDLTLSIKELSERIIQPAMIQLANQIDSDLMALYKDVPNWVGTPGNNVASYAGFAAAPQRMDEYAVPMDGRSAVLSPADHWGLLGSQTALYMQDVAKGAYRRGSLGTIGDVETFMSQNVPTHTTGDFAGTVLIDDTITGTTISYDTVKNTNQQTIHMDGFTTATAALKAGDVFTIADVYAVNPVTKAALPFLKQFTVVSDVSMSGNEGDIVVTPALIWSGAFQNVAVASGITDLNNKAVTWLGTKQTGYRQNMVFTKNAFALVMVPLVSPPGAVDVSRQSYKGTSVRVIPVYDGVNDSSAWRLDVLYGTKTLDHRLATRLSGAAA